MKSTKQFITVSILLLLFSGITLKAATVRGYVRNYNGNSPLVGALVAIEPQKGTAFKAQTMTDADGFFEFRNVPSGIYKIGGMKECFYSNS
ncbi:MAG: carboxypeptidase-like regulatory domain-containing protein, partial [Candidatus Marinimicrobia bacterium]|nr:carboxypeptidase-like regulatory domain-containing protein [Candidatus Neomarinimicrobiota bacterium]